MIVNTGLNAIRDAVRPIVVNMKAGQSNDPNSVSMTDLVSETYNALGVIDNTNGSEYGASLHKMRISTSDANGTTLREVGTFVEDYAMLQRLTHPDVEKDETFEVLYEIKLQVVNV